MEYNQIMETDSWQLCDDLLALLARLKGAIASTADAHDLTPMQLYALYAIVSGEATMGRLAAALHCDASNVTGIVDRLVAQGLARTQTSAHDRRTKVLSIEPRGRDIIDDFVSGLPERMGCPMLSTVEGSKLHKYISKLMA